MYQLLCEPTALVGRIYQDRKVVAEIIHGYANLEHSILATANTLFPISSMTKQFTAMVIMMLQEQGFLRYQDRIGRYLEDFPEYGAELTICQLLNHTSGLLDPYAYYSANNLNSFGLDNRAIYELLLDEQSLTFPPGERFEYSNSNYILLSKIGEVVAGQSFAHILNSLVFSKLNMDSALLYDNRYVIKKRAYGYQRQNEQFMTTEIAWFSYRDGGIHASLTDMEKWMFGLLKD